MKHREPVAGASDQWKLSQKLVVSMVMKQLQCDAPRLDIGSDVLDLPPTNRHDQHDCMFSLVGNPYN